MFKLVMRSSLRIVVIILLALAGIVFMQSRTIAYGELTWTRIGFYPLVKKSIHVVKYEDKTLCAEVLDEVEAPWVRANADYTLSVSYGRIGRETTVNYSVMADEFVPARPHEVYGYDFSFTTLLNERADMFLGPEIAAFRERLAAWAREKSELTNG